MKDVKRDQPPKQDIRLPAPHPSTGIISPKPLFPIVQEQRHKTCLLVELWLFIAGLYTRASLFEDAKAAVDEAAELVLLMEMQLATETSSAKAFATKGWGGRRAVEELWGDISTAVRFPCSPLLRQRQRLTPEPERQLADRPVSPLRRDNALRESAFALPRPSRRYSWPLQSSPGHLILCPTSRSP